MEDQVFGIISLAIWFRDFLPRYLQIVQLAVLAVGIESESLTDWEQNNFGLRTEHHRDDLITRVNLDQNAPRLVKTHKRGRQMRRPSRNQEKKNINFLLRGRNRSLETTRDPPQLMEDEVESAFSLSDNSNFAASIRHKPSFADFKEKFLNVPRPEPAEEVRLTGKRK